MNCLKDETIAALARGAIPWRELEHIRAHLPACSRCCDAIARATRDRRVEPRQDLEPPREPEPAQVPATRPPADYGAPRFVRWAAVVVAGLTLGLCALWASPQPRIQAWVQGVTPRLERLAERAGGAAGALVQRAEAQPLWQSLRGKLGELLAPRPEGPEAVTPEVAGPPQAAAPVDPEQRAR